MWNAITSFWVSYGPWIGASLIPTVITGLSLSTKTVDGGPMVSKVWDLIKQVMNFLSLATHKDVPGTFQLPLKLGKLVNKKSVPPASVGVILFVFLGLTSTNCSWFSHEATIAKNIAIDCTKAEIATESSNLAPAIVAVAGGTSLENVISAFIKQFGENVAACAAGRAGELLLAKARVGDNSPTDPALVNIHNLIVTKKWVYKGDK